MQMDTFKSNVILVDADYADRVAGRLRTDFCSMLHREIATVDMTEWLVCLAMEVENRKEDRQAVFLYRCPQMDHFVPDSLTDDVDGKAFEDLQLGEFLLSSICREEPATEHFFAECVEALLSAKEVETLTVVTDNAEAIAALQKGGGEGKQAILFSMTPAEGVRFLPLGFSLMHAMGIRADELGRMQ